MRAGQALAESYIQGRVNLTKSQIAEFNLSVSVLSGYVLDAIVTWGNEFNDRVLAIKNEGVILKIVLCSILFIIHIVLF